MKWRELLWLVTMVGYAVSFSMFGILAWLFFTAYFGPSMAAIVYVDRFGEANLEAIVIPITIMFCLVGLIGSAYLCTTDRGS